MPNFDLWRLSGVKIGPSLLLPVTLYFGPGRRRVLPAVVTTFGRRVLIVTGPGTLTAMAEEVAALLRENGVRVEVLAVVDREPTLDMIGAIVATARAEAAEVLLGLGGGSCLDAAKAAAGLVGAEGEIEEYFYGSRQLMQPGLPWVAVPTTAGTGAEVTPNAVLTDQKARVKQSIRSEFLYARAAVVDPELTLGLPRAQTIYSAMDALSHAVEAYVSKGANDLTDLFALEAARLIPANLLRLQEEEALDPRTALARASLLAGVALANARLGAVHGLAHPLGVYYNLPHGLVCGVLLPLVMRFNLQVAYEKFARLAEVWGVGAPGDVFDRAAAAIRHVMHLNKRLGIPSTFRSMGLREEDFTALVEGALPSGSLAANPRPAGREELLGLLRELI
ncbi:MAG: iron-containing alcohol dehydrogenase [Firmicutes bacterium]|nr:iron-containing alcohol dehydrogenase [Bacillota bacterium]